MADDTIELPRNEIDFRIDALSPSAIELLREWKGVDRGYPRGELPEGIYDLAHQGFVQVEPTSDHTGTEVMRCVITFDGNNAQIRIGSGIYAHHKRIYAERAARDARQSIDQASMETHPLYGIF